MSIIYLIAVGIWRAYLKWEAKMAEYAPYHMLVYPSGELPPDWPGIWAQKTERIQCGYCGTNQEAVIEMSQDWPIRRRYAHQCTKCQRWNNETDWIRLSEEEQ